MELERAFSFLYGKLRADSAMAGVAIYEDEAPGEADYPFVLISVQDADDVTGVNLSRCEVICTALVRVIGEGTDMARLVTLADRVDALLHGAQDGQSIVASRVRPFRASGWQNGVLYKNLGGFYQVEIGA